MCLKLQSSINFPITVKQVILTGRLNPVLSLFHKYKHSDMKKADELLSQVGIYKLKDRMISELSGGEFQNAYSRALAVEPKLYC